MKALFAGRRVFYVGSLHSRHTRTLLGGQRVTLQHVEVLRKDGVEAFAVTSEAGISGIHTRLFPGSSSGLMHIKQFQREINPNDDLVVLPGRFADQLDEFPGHHKILFSQGIWITLNALNHSDNCNSPFQHPSLRSIMVVSEGNAQIAKLLRPTCPVVIVRNAVDRPINVDFTNRKRLILYSSLQRPEKNPWDTRAVLQVLRARHKLYTQPEYIELEGIPHAQLLKLMREASTLLFLSTHEGLPLAPLEAMANGTLPLGYDRSPMSEVIHKQCLFRFGDIQGIADVIESILNEPKAWADVRMECYDLVSKWSLQTQAESIQRAWKFILEKTNESQ